MRANRFSLPLVACCLLAGCHGGPETDLLERELRLQEDYIYHLQDKLDEYQQRLDACQQDGPETSSSSESERQSPKRERSRPPRGDSSGRSGRQPIIADEPQLDSDAIPTAPPSVELGTPVAPQSPEGEVPGGAEGSPNLLSPESSSVPEMSEPAAPPGGAGVDAAEQMPAEETILPVPADEPTTRAAGATQVQLVALKHSESAQAAVHASRSATRPPLLVAVVRPIAFDGRTAAPDGSVSLMLVDPSQNGPASRIARWDFAGDEVFENWRDDEMGGAAHLELIWPPEALGKRNLQVWVRWMNPDGSKAITQQACDPRALRLMALRDGGSDEPSQTAWKSADPFVARKESALAGTQRWKPRAAGMESPPREPIAGRTDRESHSAVIQASAQAPIQPADAALGREESIDLGPRSPMQPQELDDGAQQRPQWKPYRRGAEGAEEDGTTECTEDTERR